MLPAAVRSGQQNQWCADQDWDFLDLWIRIMICEISGSGLCFLKYLAPDPRSQWWFGFAIHNPDPDTAVKCVFLRYIFKKLYSDCWSGLWFFKMLDKDLDCDFYNHNLQHWTKHLFDWCPENIHSFLIWSKSFWGAFFFFFFFFFFLCFF